MKQVPPIRPNFEEANYDVNKIAPYTLEDPLCFADGTPLKSPADWPARRREILDIFAREMYGAEPPAPEEMVIDASKRRVKQRAYNIPLIVGGLRNQVADFLYQINAVKDRK